MNEGQASRDTRRILLRIIAVGLVSSVVAHILNCCYAIVFSVGNSMTDFSPGTVVRQLFAPDTRKMSWPGLMSHQIPRSLIEVSQSARHRRLNAVNVTDLH